MVDPDSRTKSEDRLQRDNIDFIRQELIPEMVHNRCFCEPGSREFVEFESANVVPFTVKNIECTSCEMYRVRAQVKFSGETCSFPLIVRLPENSADFSIPPGSFQNEEMFYSKMTSELGTDCIPRCYLSDLGRYGRPVIVLEDLVAYGYVRVEHKLDENHLNLCVKTLGMFHGKGLKLRADKFHTFREFYAKLSEISFDDDSIKRYCRNATRILDVLKLLTDSRLVEKIKQKLGKDPLNIMKSLATEINDVSTICHGSFSRSNLVYTYENEKPSDVKVIDWQTMRYCSPAIDLGPILFVNLPDGGLPKVQDVLQVYLDAVKNEYPEVPSEQLIRDIISKLLFAYIILCTRKDIGDDELVTVLHILDDLGTFD